MRIEWTADSGTEVTLGTVIYVNQGLPEMQFDLSTGSYGDEDRQSTITNITEPAARELRARLDEFLAQVERARTPV